MRFPRVAAAQATVLVAVVAVACLVVSGHLPPRGLATGIVRICANTSCVGGQPFVGATLIFRPIGSSNVFVARTDSNGQYSVTLPPARYAIQQQFAVSADAVGDAGKVITADFPSGPKELTLTAGQHTVADYSVYIMQQ